MTITLTILGVCMAVLKVLVISCMFVAGYYWGQSTQCRDCTIPTKED